MNKNIDALSAERALKLALEALRDYRRSDDDRVSVAMGILQEALAHAPTEREQPAQELLAWKNAAIRVGEELSSVGPNGYYNMTADQWLAWAMDQQPRGKNSLAEQPAQQEPVAYILHHKNGDHLVWFDPKRKRTPLYTSPPANANAGKPWVGLTQGECEFLAELQSASPTAIVRLTEAKLREKNT